MKKNYFKLILDIIMFIGLICLSRISITGMNGHEKLGVIICVLFIIHILLNIKWVKAVSKRIFDKKLPGKMRFAASINLLLLIFALVALISGIAVSVTILTSVTFGNRAVLVMIHRISALLLFISVLIHCGMHFKYIGKMLKKPFNKSKCEKIAA